MLRAGKLENIKHEMKSLTINILGICEPRWPEKKIFGMMDSSSVKGQGRV